MTAPERACAEARAAEAALDEALRRAFWHRLHNAQMPPMLALRIAARTLGTLYRQMAEAHQGAGGCACGWEPDPDEDLVLLEAHLAAALLEPADYDLAAMPAAGHA